MASDIQMYKKGKVCISCKKFSFTGTRWRILSIEVDISCGLPCFEIVGLPDTSVKEAKERVKTAIRNTGVEFLSRRIVVNLAPADIRKEGASFRFANCIRNTDC